METPSPNVTTDLLARCLAVLRNAEGPVTAAEIAARVYLGGNRESRRRHVRAIIAELRCRGHWIVAANALGCWLTADETIWKDYLEHRTIDGRRIIGEASRRKKAVLVDAKGQALLFSPKIG
ncbi:MAG: hypothetical protein LLF76_02405 [Planctomycetaceae bacterium]|nr:hypothetical protein [Planctomycetaceae bacterium]